MSGVGAALLAALLLPQDDLERVVEKIEKAYAPIRSLVCQFELDMSGGERARYWGSMRRIHQLRVVRDRYQASEVFMTMSMGGMGGTTMSTSVVRQGDQVFEKAFYATMGEQQFVTARKIKADEAEAQSPFGQRMSELGGSDLGVISMAIHPRELLRPGRRIQVGRETIEGREHDTLAISSPLGYADMEMRIKHYVDAASGRFSFSECEVAGERFRLAIPEHQEVAGVPFPKVIQWLGGRFRAFDPFGQTLSIRILSANRDDIPRDPPGWIADPALPEHEAGDPKPLLASAKERPDDAVAQLRALNALLGGGGIFMRDEEGSLRETVERLRSAKSDSPLIAELACALLAAAGMTEEFDARVAAAASKGPLSPVLAVLRLKSLFERDKNEEGLKAYEACLGDPFSRACAAEYEIALRVRSAPHAAAVADLVAERTRDLDWPAKLRVLDQIEGAPPRVMRGVGAAGASRETFTKLAPDVLARLADGFAAAELRVLLARTFWKAAGEEGRAAAAYLAAVQDNAAFQALREEMTRFAAAHPIDSVVERLAKSEKLESVEFLTRHAEEKFQAGDAAAATASLETAIAHLGKGARLVDQPAFPFDEPDPGLPKLLKELAAKNQAVLARRLLVAAAGTNRELLMMWVSAGGSELTWVFRDDKPEAYRFARALDPDAASAVASQLGLGPKDVREAAEAALDGGDAQIADARHLASLIGEGMAKGEAEALAKLVGRAAASFPQDHAAAAAAGDAWHVAGDPSKAAEAYRRALDLRPDEGAEAASSEQEEDEMWPMRRIMRSREGRRSEGRFLHLPVLVKLADCLRTLHGQDKAVSDLEEWIAARPKERDRIEGARALDRLGQSRRAFELLKGVFLGVPEGWNDRNVAKLRTAAAEELMRIAASGGDAVTAYLVAEMVLERVKSTPDVDDSPYSWFTDEFPSPAFVLANQVVAQHASGEGEAKLLDAFLALEAPPPSPETEAAARRAVQGLAAPFLEEREAASEALENLGPAAAPFLRESIRSRDPEIERRARSLMRPWATRALRRNFEGRP
jgi:tetratricopeptide (TPR) repeat protein